MKRLGRVAFWIALAAYVLSFFLPTTAFLGKGNGAEAVWLSLALTPSALTGILHPGLLSRGQVASSSLGWLINVPFIIVALTILRRRPVPKRMRAILAVAAASALALPRLLEFVDFLVGYYVWCASLMFLLFCTLQVRPTPNSCPHKTGSRPRLSRKPSGDGSR